MSHLSGRLKERALAERRSCLSAGCDACPAPTGGEHPFCGWVSGLMLKQHDPQKLGLVLEAREIDEIGPLYSFREIRKDAGETKEAEQVIRAFAASGTPVIVANEEGEILNMLGEKDKIQVMQKAFAVEENESL